MVLSLGTFCLAIGPMELIILLKFNSLLFICLFVVNFVIRFCKYYLVQSQTVGNCSLPTGWGVQLFSFVGVRTGSFYIALGVLELTI